MVGWGWIILVQSSTGPQGCPCHHISRRPRGRHFSCKSQSKVSGCCPFWWKLNPIFPDLQMRMDILHSFRSWPSSLEHSSWSVGIKKIWGQTGTLWSSCPLMLSLLLSVPGMEGLVSRSAAEGRKESRLIQRLRPLECLVSFSFNLCFNLTGSLCLEQIVNNASSVCRGGCHVRIPGNTHQIEELRWRGYSSSNTNVHRMFYLNRMEKLE